MDEQKKELDDLFNFGGRIISELERASRETSDELNESNRRYEDLKAALRNILDGHKD